MYETTPVQSKYAEYFWIIVPLAVVLTLLFSS